MEPRAPHSDPEETPQENAPASRARRVLKYVLYALGGLVGLVVGLVLALLLILQTNWGAAKAGDILTGLVNPFDEAALTIGDIEGNWITGLALYDVSLVRPDTTGQDTTLRMVHVDSLKLRYNLGALLDGRLHVREVGIYSPQITARQQADSTWDLTEPFAAAEDTTAQRAFTVRVDGITLQDAGLTARFYAPGRDSTLRVTDLDARVQDLLVAENVRVDLQRLSGRALPPGETTPLRLRASAELAENRLSLRRLRLTSPRSRLVGEGTLRLPQDTSDTVDDVNFHLTADPLAFRDLAPFVPSLDPEKSVRFDVRVDGSDRLLDFDADATLSDGATLALTGTATPAAEGPLTYRLSGQVRRLDPAFFAAADTAAVSGHVNADLRVDLEGPALDRISGTATVEVFDTRLAGYALDDTHLAAHFAEGRAILDASSGLEGATLTAAGTLRPFNEIPTYDLQAHLEGLDLGRVTADTSLTTNLAGMLSLEGRGTAPQAADLTARLALAPSSVNRAQIQDGHLEARLTDGNLRFDGRFRTAQGTFAVDGRAENLAGEMPAYQADARLDRLDLAALTGDTVRSAVSGAFSLRGQGTDPQAMQIARADLSLQNARYGSYVLERLNLDATLRDGQLRASGEASLEGGGSFVLAATARPFEGMPTYTLTRGSFQDVDIGAFMQDSTQQSSLNGTLHLEGRGADPEAMHLDVTLSLNESRLNQQAINAAALEAALEGGVLSYQVLLDIPAGGMRLAGTARPFAETPTYAVREGVLNGINLGALVGAQNLATSLNGVLSLEGRGTEPSSMALNVQLAMDRSAINDAILQDGTLHATVADGQAELDGTFVLGEGRLELSAAGRFPADRPPRYQAGAILEDLNLAALTGNDSLQAHLSMRADVKGQGFDPQTMTLAGAITSQEARYAEAVLNRFDLDVRLDGGLLRVDTLLVQSNILSASGGGRIALTDSIGGPASTFALEADISNLRPVRPLLGAEVLSLDGGHLAIRAYGPPGQLRFDGSAELQSLVYNQIRLAGFDGSVSGELGRDLTLETIETRASLAYFSLPSLTAENADFEAVYDDEQVTFSTNLILDETREAHLAGVLDLRPDRRQLRLDAFRVRLGQDRWRLLQPAAISYGDAYRISSLLLYSGNQQIAVDGVVDFDGEQSLVLTIEAFRIGAVADLLEYEGLNGTLSGTLVLRGPAQNPNMAGTLNLDVESYDEPVGDLRLALDYDTLRMQVDARLMHQDGSTLTVEGHLPLDLRLSAPADSVAPAPDLLARQELALVAEADSFDIGWVRPFLDPETISRIDGTLTARFTLGGTPAQPDLEGQATLTNGTLGLEALGLTYHDIRARFALTGDRIILERAALEAGEGRLLAEGTINLPDLTLGEYDLSFEADDFLAISTSQYRAILDADLALSGTTEQPRLQGDVQVLSADIFLDGGAESADVEPVTLSERDLQMLERRFGVRISEADTTTLDTYAALAMDLDVEIERDVWLRSTANPEMYIQFTGSLDLQKAPQQDLQVFGTIQAIPERSRILQFGRRFNITSGVITFNGPMGSPIVDIEGELPIRSRRNPGQNEVVITLAVEGRPDNLDLTLGSTPQMELADIVSYIAIGRPANEALQLGGGGQEAGLLAPAQNIALGQIANILESRAGSELGLDVIEIDVTGPQGPTFAAGKYVTRRLYIAVQQSIGNNTTGLREGADTTPTRITLEYELTSWLLARLIGGTNTVRFNLLWEHAY